MRPWKTEQTQLRSEVASFRSACGRTAQSHRKWIASQPTSKNKCEALQTVQAFKSRFLFDSRLPVKCSYQFIQFRTL